MWLGAFDETLISGRGAQRVEAVRVFLRDWSHVATVMPRYISRSSAVEVPRMTASIPRVLDDAAVLSLLAEELASGHLLLAPDPFPFDHPAWVSHSHDSFFMTLSTDSDLPPPKDNLRFETFPNSSFFNIWRGIPDVGPIVDGAVLEFAEPPMSQYLVVALLDEVPVGTMRITTGFGLGGMSLLAVTNTSRRGGIARQLVAHGLLIASRDGCGIVHFQVDGQNESAIRLYTELGANTVTTYRYLRRI